MKMTALFIFLAAFAVSSTVSQVNYVVSNKLDDESSLSDITDVDSETFKENHTEQAGNTVDIKCYYECLCPDCRNFDAIYFEPVVQKLSQYIKLHTYPYGNAQTIEKDGRVVFKCQHGPEECYGNKLHACALDVLRGNIAQAVLYNICMMDSSQGGRGSDDAASDACGKTMSINSEPIKQCAKGEKGTQLLKYYGEESKMANFNYVPYILINGKENNGTNFFRDVCAAFRNPPPECNQLY